ncbi:transglycosylase SLT domain-containing protein, partial [Bacillus cereus]
RYLKTLHGMFGGDWRLATMAYNAGEYRVLQSMRKAGMNAQNAKPSALPGLSPVTHAYVEKLHALACVLEDVEDQPGVM